jgi:hypothetical protein
MFFYPHEQFPHTYLLLISAAILLAFAGLKMTNRRAVWFLSISTPGILLLPDYIVGAFALRYKEFIPTSIILQGTFLYFFFCPAIWVFPIIFSVQIRKLARSDQQPMANPPYLQVGLLAFLYLWSDIFLWFAHGFIGH